MIIQSLNKHSVAMVINRIIDNTSVAIASINRRPVIASREMALAHPRKNGATIFGINSKKNLIANGQLGQMELR